MANLLGALHGVARVADVVGLERHHGLHLQQRGVDEGVVHALAGPAGGDSHGIGSEGGSMFDVSCFFPTSVPWLTGARWDNVRCAMKNDAVPPNHGESVLYKEREPVFLL